MGLLSSIGAYFLPVILALIATFGAVSPSLPNVEQKLSPPAKIEATVEVTPLTFVRKDDSNDNMVGKRLSRGERLCRKVVSSIIKEKGLVANVMYNYRPDFLQNPRTRRNLELDIYAEIIRPVSKILAIEFNGRQHDEFVPKYHKSRLEFSNQQYRDQLKSDICKEKEIKLITISHSDIDHLKTDDEKEQKIRDMLLDAF